MLRSLLPSAPLIVAGLGSTYSSGNAVGDFIGGEVQPFPSSCENGVLKLRGSYTASERTFPSCSLLGEPGTQVIIEAPLYFNGDVIVQGELRVSSDRMLSTPCLIVKGSLFLKGANASFRGCVNTGNSRDGPPHGGAAHVSENVIMIASNVTFEHGMAHRGGCLFVGKDFKQNEASVALFRNCSASDGPGGGLCVVENFEQTGSSAAEFDECQANGENANGGGLFAKSFFQEGSSSILFRNCSATGGGGLYADEAVQTDGSWGQFENCMSLDGGGGGLKVLGTFQHERSSLQFKDCWSLQDGGCLWALGMFQVMSTAFFANCRTSQGRGGGIHAWKLYQASFSSLHFENCKASGSGGGMCIRNTFDQSNSDARFSNCSSKRSGGGAFVEREFSQQRDGSVKFENCSANAGGGLKARSFLQNAGSKAEFDACTSVDDGGGSFVDIFQQDAVSAALFLRCSAERNGGGLSVGRLHGNGSMYFGTCQAEAGGGFQIQTSVEFNGPLVLKECHSNSHGGGILSLSDRPGRFRSLDFEECTSATAAALAVTRGTAEIRITFLRLLDNHGSDSIDISVSGSLIIENASFEARYQEGAGGHPAVSISAHHILTEAEIDCTRLKACRLMADEFQVAGFLCSVGSGVGSQDVTQHGCLRCREGYTQICHQSQRSCQRCPTKARRCFAGSLEMEPGVMLEVQNVSRTFRCPNEVACPGGSLPSKEIGMCRPGYNGRGCVNCDNGYAMADSSVLSCTACSDNGWVQTVQWLLFFLQRVFLFALAATSVLGARSAGSVKRSAIYINQLIAFATISKTIMTAVLQTQTAKEMGRMAAAMIQTSVILADSGSGEGALLGASTQCLLSYIDFGKSLAGAHFLELAVAALLVAGLASLKDSKVALVAGLNCFLPPVVAGFGKYLVCYRLEPEDRFLGLHCPFLPTESLTVGFVLVCCGLILCFAAGLCKWLSLSQSKQSKGKLQELDEAHVIFLTSKYKPRYTLFETERLVRKTLITLIRAVLPISLSPALQMGSLGVVVLTSLLLYTLCNPYHAPEFNWSEIALLSTAAYMVFLTSSLLANESHWAHSVLTQQAIILCTAVAATVASSLMTCRILLEKLRERREGARDLEREQQAHAGSIELQSQSWARR